MYSASLISCSEPQPSAFSNASFRGGENTAPLLLYTLPVLRAFRRDVMAGTGRVPMEVDTGAATMTNENVVR